MTLRIYNDTRQSVLATRAAIASTPAERIAGLIGVRSLEEGQGLFFPKCAAVHTVQMCMTIDIVFIDIVRHQVVRTIQQAAPGCHFNTIKIPLDDCAALELPAGTVKATGTVPGDILSLMSSARTTQEELNQIGAL